jgi:hypothetical protein
VGDPVMEQLRWGSLPPLAHSSPVLGARLVARDDSLLAKVDRR